MTVCNFHIKIEFNLHKHYTLIFSILKLELYRKFKSSSNNQSSTQKREVQQLFKTLKVLFYNI